MAINTSAYAWIMASGEAVAGCITVISDAAVEGVARAFGIDLAERVGSPSDEMFSAAGLNDVAWVGQAGAAQVVFEDNGYQGSRHEVLTEASKVSGSGKAASIFWNVDGVVVFSCARRGKLVCSFELIEPSEEEVAELPGPLRPFLRLLDRDDADLVAIGATMVEKFTGASFDASTHDNASLHPLEPRPSDLRTHTPDSSPLGYRDPELLEAIVALSADQQRALAEWVTVVAVREAGLAETEAVQLVTRQYGTMQAVSLPPAAAALAHQLEQEQRKAHNAYDAEAHRRSAAGLPLEIAFIDQGRWAGEALLASTHPDPLSAALGCVDAAMHVFSCARTHRAVEFIEDNAGRDAVYELESVGRKDAFKAALKSALVDDGGAWQSIAAALPAPLTSAQRAEAIELDRQREERGEFDTWRYT